MFGILSAALAFFTLIASLVPYLPIAHGAIRVFDFPRVQFLILAFASVLLLVMSSIAPPWKILAISAGVVAMILQLAHIARFTPLWPKQTSDFDGSWNDKQCFSLLVSNVKQGNRNYQPLCNLIKQTDPDIAVFMEVDQPWLDGLQPALEDYPHSLSCPLDNSFGMHLVSKFDISNSKVRYLLKEEVPSFDLEIEHPASGRFRLICVHPEPPVPYTDSIGRDAEIALAGELVRQKQMPTLVTGDLNDVAWSRTTRRFVRLSGQQDPRQGRGMYNSFDARYWPVRWPLDHIFNSAEFALVSIERQPFVGSDHFPMLYRFALTGTKNGEQPDPPEQQDLEEAEDAIRTERNRDKPPVGEDWEDG